MKNAIAFIEHRNGVARRSSVEAACAARTLADQLGGKALAVVAGRDAAAVAQLLAKYPLDEIHVLDDAAAGSETQIDALESVARAAGPSVVLVGNTLIGRDVGSRFAARVDAGVTADVTALSVEGGRVACVSPKLGGTTIVTCAFRNTDYGVVAIRPNIFPIAEGAGAGTIVSDRAEREAVRVTVEEEVEEAAAELGVEEASVLCRAARDGRPRAVQRHAQGAGRSRCGAVGASRAAVDAG